MKQLINGAIRGSLAVNYLHAMCSVPLFHSMSHAEVDIPMLLAGGKYESSYRNPCWKGDKGQAGGLKCIPYVYIMGAFHSGVTSLGVKVSRHPSVLTVRPVLPKLKNYRGQEICPPNSWTPPSS